MPSSIWISIRSTIRLPVSVLGSDSGGCPFNRECGFRIHASARSLLPKTDSASESTRITRSTRSDSSTVSFSRRETAMLKGSERNDGGGDLRTPKTKGNKAGHYGGRQLSFYDPEGLRLNRRNRYAEPFAYLHVDGVHFGYLNTLRHMLDGKV
jgi:hypothetical protein